ncbi:FxsA family protein [Gilvimarinus sp. 1_MG-2023]|uniref:FxsA family protein n=1 Tax=Gilvimarinus sp. 1_MG-2023 TaxID=3062638 RepID=UPI0026E187EF|nr:FxsA family protein [Gilvimarinus sp. 1_MG-2023]MDO6747904.1 FxsA family protein [Gilvimarinus sp. 1_MG-2023]
MPFVLLLFIGVPLVEIALFIQVGDELGVLPTVALVVITAVLGVGLLRWQGFETMTRARSRMEAGEMPAREMAEGFMLLVAGVLLMTPGFFTDTVGFLLLVPWLRYALFQWVAPRFVVRTQSPFSGPNAGSHQTFEGEFYHPDEPVQEKPRLDKK